MKDVIDVIRAKHGIEVVLDCEPLKQAGIDPAATLVSKSCKDISLRSAKDGIVAVDLEEPYSQVCAGGAGRYLIFQLKQAKKLVLFDIEKAAIIKTMAAPSDW